MTKIEFVLLAESSAHDDLYAQIRAFANRQSNAGGLFVWCDSHENRSAVTRHLVDIAVAPGSDGRETTDNDACNSALHCLDHGEILVEYEGEPDGSHATMVNMTDQVPWFFSRFEHIVELVQASPNARKMGRERYRFYKHRGYPLRHRQL
ncbi:MAG: DNA polymerase III subunit chi [Pseudomonadota bacterium]